MSTSLVLFSIKLYVVVLVCFDCSCEKDSLSVKFHTGVLFIVCVCLFSVYFLLFYAIQ